MRSSPSIVPHGANQDTYLVLEDFGRIGCSWRETDAESADRETLIRDLVEGQYREDGDMIGRDHLLYRVDRRAVRHRRRPK
jgi:hypothetical protein